MLSILKASGFARNHKIGPKLELMLFDRIRNVIIQTTPVILVGDHVDEDTSIVTMR